MPKIDYKRLIKAIGIVFGCILLGFIFVYIMGLVSMYLTFEMFFWAVIVLLLLWFIVGAYLMLEPKESE